MRWLDPVALAGVTSKAGHGSPALNSCLQPSGGAVCDLAPVQDDASLSLLHRMADHGLVTKVEDTAVGSKWQLTLRSLPHLRPLATFDRPCLVLTPRITDPARWRDMTDWELLLALEEDPGWGPTGGPGLQTFPGVVYVSAPSPGAQTGCCLLA